MRKNLLWKTEHTYRSCSQPYPSKQITFSNPFSVYLAKVSSFTSGFAQIQVLSDVRMRSAVNTRLESCTNEIRIDIQRVSSHLYAHTVSFDC